MRRMRAFLVVPCIFSTLVAACAEQPERRENERDARPRDEAQPSPSRLDEVHALEWARDPIVLRHLSDDAPEVRRATARALGRIAAPGDEVAAVVSERIAGALAKQLADEKDVEVRKEILYALGQAGTTGAAKALIAARDEAKRGEEERVVASTALRFAATEEDRAALVRGLESGLPGVVRDSALTLGILQKRSKGLAGIDTTTRTALLRHLEAVPVSKPGVPETLYALTFAAAYLGDPREDMRAVLAYQLEKSNDEDTRAIAARGLAMSAIGEIADKPAPAVLLGEFPDARVSVEVVHALSKHKKDEKARARLVEILRSRTSSFHARAEAASALAEGEGKGEVEVLEASAMEDASPTVKGAALAALAKREPVAAWKIVLPFVSDGKENYRVVCDDAMTSKIVIGALGVLVDHAISGPSAKRSLRFTARHRDQDARVRTAALEALSNAKEPKEAIAVSLELIANEKNTGVFEMATDILAKQGGDDVEAALAKAYERTKGDHDFAEPRENIVNDLAELKEKLGKKGRATIEAALKDPEESVVSAAKKALALLDGKAPEASPGAKEKAPPKVLPRDFQGKKPIVTIETSKGTFEVELFPEEAPIHVASTVALVEKKFYDGLTWHRVVSDFVVQGGCPRGDGSGDAGYHVPDEISQRLYVRGTLGMPKTAIKDTGGCQLFFTHGRTPHLDGKYTIFGKIRKGVETIDLLEVGDKIVKARVTFE